MFGASQLPTNLKKMPQSHIVNKRDPYKLRRSQGT